ncbi:MAG: polysaccharide biosynthesis protein, partial [[Eubacterium] sulci]|nr:polysaccharide biosynthesis protein [[Eubacterium] sulci]
VKKYNVNEIIIAMPSAASEDIKKIIAICQETKLPVKILPSVAKSLSSSIVRELRAISYEDLLGRDAIEVDATGINNFIKDKTILITGGGGSIGSELCRQVIRYEPKRLIIFDIYENNAYEIQMELERHYPYAEIITLIGSIRDYDRLEAMFDEHRPQIVYHAAAHKHVPLMEDSPNEAIKNNCLGTLNLVKLADKYLVDNFTLISTDKAVRPTNIMGASKRICEMIVQVYARKSEHTRYSAVRFGNVLGSNGSVIPLFLKQIEEGGPVTVTHKDIRRFFMTIPEAVSLVLQASLFAKGGEIFVLDMGEPVKIYELAENLIKMKGFRPHQDIEIEVVGLRPGEKLYEEVLMDEEGLNKTENNMIFVGQPIKMDDDEFLTSLDTLIRESEKNDGNIKGLVEGVCKTYTITENKKS